MYSHILASALTTLSLFAGVALADSQTTAPSSQPTTAPTTRPAVDVTAVKRGALSLVIDGQGSFEPLDAFEVRIRPKAYAGEMTITSIAANGSAVKKGDLLLEIDPVVIKRMLAASENELLNSRASLAKAVADAKLAEEAEAMALKQQQTSVKEAEEGLKWFESTDGPQFLKQIDLSLQQYDDQVRDAQDELDQLKKMYKSEELTNATADVVVRQAMRKLEVSKATVAMMRERAEKARNLTLPQVRQRYVDGVDVAHQQMALFQTAQTQQKVQRQTGLAAVKAATAASELRDNDLRADLEKLSVRAPADGIVEYGQLLNGNWQGGDPRTLRIGEKTMAQAVLMTVFTPGKLRVILDLPETRFFAIKSGQKASVSPVAYPELKYEGWGEPGQRPITAPGGSYVLQIATGEVDSRLAPGMKAAVHMDVPLVDGALLVPNTAVASAIVWVKPAGGAEESRHVVTGRTDGKSTEILSGLKEGEEVLTHAKPTP